VETRELIQTALLIALCVAVGYLMAGVPNVELISAAIFTAGLLVGVRRGALVGAVAEALYAGFNPYGVSAPPLLAAQILGMTLIGCTGGALRGIWLHLEWRLQSAVAGVAGFVLTLVFDVLTNSAVYVSLRETTSWAAVVVGGVTFPFPFAHALGNTLAFALVAPSVCAAFARRSVP
jgi:uncharacterized membrane protein